MSSFRFAEALSRKLRVPTSSSPPPPRVGAGCRKMAFRLDSGKGGATVAPSALLSEVSGVFWEAGLGLFRGRVPFAITGHREPL